MPILMECLLRDANSHKLTNHHKTFQGCMLGHCSPQLMVQALQSHLVSHLSWQHMMKIFFKENVKTICVCLTEALQLKDCLTIPRVKTFSLIHLFPASSMCQFLQNENLKSNIFSFFSATPFSYNLANVRVRKSWAFKNILISQDSEHTVVFAWKPLSFSTTLSLTIPISAFFIPLPIKNFLSIKLSKVFSFLHFQAGQLPRSNSISICDPWLWKI